MKEYDELRDGRDADELKAIARALDVSDAPAPREAFLAALRGRLESARAARPAARGFARLRLGIVAPIVAASVLAIVVASAYPQPGTATVPEGERLVLASANGFVTYDTRTLQQKEQVTVPAPEPWVVLAPDQRTLVFTFGSGLSRQMRVFDLGSGRWDNVPGLVNPRQFALSRDGSKAYVRDVDRIAVVDIASRKVVSSIATPGVEDSPLYLAPDDRRLFQFVPQGALVVYDVAALREMRRLPVDLRDQPELSASARVVFSPDGSKLYAVGSTGSPSGPVRIQVLDTTTLQTVAAASIDPTQAPRLSATPPNLAERASELLGGLGFVADAKELGTVTQIALSPDGTTLYAARGSVGNGVLVVDTARLAALGLLESGRQVFGVQLSPDGSRVYALAAPLGALGDSTLLAVDARSHALLASASTRRAAPDTSVILFKP